MVSKRAPLWIALLWLATVAGVSTVTWTVISAAGTQVGQPAAAIGPTAQISPPASSQAGSPVSVVPVPHSGHPASKGSSGGGTETWAGRPGKVTARCQGNTARLVSAIPAIGFQISSHETDRGGVVVEFEALNSDEGRETTVLVSCRDGEPAFSER